MRQFLKTVGIWLLAPAIVAALVVLAVGLYELIFTGRMSSSEFFAGLLVVLPISVIGSYLFGGIQAFVVGVGCALWELRRGPVPVTLPLLLSFLAWVGFSWATWVSNDHQSLNAVMLSQNGTLWLAIHLFAGSGFWWLAHRWAA